MLGHLECHESFGTDCLQSQLHLHIYELSDPWLLEETSNSSRKQKVQNKSSVLIPADFTKKGTCPLEKELWMSQYQRAVLCHPGAHGRCWVALPPQLCPPQRTSRSEQKHCTAGGHSDLPESSWGCCSPVVGPQQEGLLCTRAFVPEETCPCMKSQEGLSKRDPGLL